MCILSYAIVITNPIDAMPSWKYLVVDEGHRFVLYALFSLVFPSSKQALSAQNQEPELPLDTRAQEL